MHIPFAFPGSTVHGAFVVEAFGLGASLKRILIISNHF
jgi:hypothetical protein